MATGKIPPPMRGRNSFGGHVSLLNDTVSVETQIEAQARQMTEQIVRELDIMSHELTSRGTSAAGTPPPLMRSASSDSTANESSVPSTPDGAAMPHAFWPAKYPAQKEPSDALLSPYSSMPLPHPHSAKHADAHVSKAPIYTIYTPYEGWMTTLPPPRAAHPESRANAQTPHAASFQHQYVPEPLPSPTSVVRPNQVTKSSNNKYPCPNAKQYNCTAKFTTSGHAARHSKTHTGVKDHECPQCGKKFSRKDNMEQHRTTHKDGRSAAKASKRRKPSSDATSPETALLSPFSTATTAPSSPSVADLSLAHNGHFSNQDFVPQPASGLDALATAAGAHRYRGSEVDPREFEGNDYEQRSLGERRHRI